MKAGVVSPIDADYQKAVESHGFKLDSFGISNKSVTELHSTFGLKRSL